MHKTKAQQLPWILFCKRQHDIAAHTMPEHDTFTDACMLQYRVYIAGKIIHGYRSQRIRNGFAVAATRQVGCDHLAMAFKTIHLRVPYSMVFCKTMNQHEGNAFPFGTVKTTGRLVLEIMVHL